MTFPAEPVPDGAIFAPHHLYIGALGLLFVAGIVWDNQPRREPLAVAAAALVALFAFASIWPYYPATGAALTLAGLLAALVAVSVPWGFWPTVPLRVRLPAVLAVFVAADDALSHAFGVWTPLDALFHRGILPVIA